jgi:hypothetical protein
MGLLSAIALPLLAVMNDPTAFFMVATIVIVVGCLSVLIPIFLPKYWQRHVQEPKGRNKIGRMHNTSNGTKHTWRIPEPQKSSEDADGGDSRHSISSGPSASKLSTFFASEPMSIKRISSGNNTVKDKVPAGPKPSETFAAIGAARHSIMKSPVKVAKAILLAPFPSSQGSTEEPPPSRLEVLLEADEDKE